MMKNYFQKLYNETGKKPFTFLNVFLLLILPVLSLFLGGYLSEASGNGTLGVVMMILLTLAAWALNMVLLIKNFGGKGVGLFFLTLLASVAFLWTLVLWPLIKIGFRGGMAVTQANLGNVTASVNSSRRMGATRPVKKSAFNWFKYDGTFIKDEKDVMPEEIQGFALDEGAYTYDQNQSARNLGFQNGKDAEMSGRRWNAQNNSWE